MNKNKTSIQHTLQASWAKSLICSLFCVGEEKFKTEKKLIINPQPACSAGTLAVILKDVNEFIKELWKL